jgi:hypothetical protein
MPAKEAMPLLSNRQGLLPLHTGPSQLFAEFATPIPAQVYRSAWPWIGQRAVVFSRAVILVYLTVLFPLLVYSKLAESAAANQTRWNVLFDFWIIAHLLQWLWHVESFVSHTSRLLKVDYLRLTPWIFSSGA